VLSRRNTRPRAGLEDPADEQRFLVEKLRQISGAGQAVSGHLRDASQLRKAVEKAQRLL